MKKGKFVNKLDGLSIFGLFASLIWIYIRCAAANAENEVVEDEEAEEYVSAEDILKNFDPDTRWYSMSDAVEAIQRSDMTDYYKNECLTPILKVSPKKASSDFWKAVTVVASNNDMTDYYRSRSIQKLCNSRM